MGALDVMAPAPGPANALTMASCSAKTQALNQNDFSDLFQACRGQAGSPACCQKVRIPP